MYCKSTFLLLSCFSILYQDEYTKAEPIRGKPIRDVGRTEFLFIVSIAYRFKEYSPNYRHICTGTLITKKHVITAAHCFDHKLLGDIEINIGSADLWDPQVESYYPSLWITYDKWAEINCVRKRHEVNDIAIIRLSESVKDKRVKPAKLTKKLNINLEGSKAFIAGWGITSDTEMLMPRVMKAAEVEIRPLEICSNRVARIRDPLNVDRSFFIHNRFICSTANPYLLLTCGDSGGPLLSKSNKLLAVNSGICSNITETHLSQEFLDRFSVNLHSGVNYYKNFIKHVLKNY